MPDYQKMYFTLFNAITDALAALEKHEPFICRDLLIAAQQTTEEMYIDCQ